MFTFMWSNPGNMAMGLVLFYRCMRCFNNISANIMADMYQDSYTNVRVMLNPGTAASGGQQNPYLATSTGPGPGPLMSPAVAALYQVSICFTHGTGLARKTPAPTLVCF